MDSSQAYQTPDYWRKFWVGKLSKKLSQEQTDIQDVNNYIRIVNTYLEENPGNPRGISVSALEKFIAKYSDKVLPVLRYFYEYIANSELHLKRLMLSIQTPLQMSNEQCSKENTDTGQNLKRTAIPEIVSSKKTDKTDKLYSVNTHGNIISPADRKQLLTDLKREIDCRNYSQQTVKHYLGAVSSFLDYMTVESSKNWSLAFKEYLIWLRDIKHLAPNTINQHAASISFFFLEVLELEIGEDIFTRMKTDKALPRVHSLERINSIISTPANFKHRLILMITYGCGLRLSEIRTLRPSDIDIERKVITLRKAKGKKDRVVMLDDELTPYIENWMKNGCGKEYLFEGYTPGEPLSKRTIEKIYTNTCTKLNIDPKGGIHSLRHSFATHLLVEQSRKRQL